MMSFLRKYNKYILAVGGTLLMIAFLIPQAITSLSQRGGVSAASVAVVGPDQTNGATTDSDECHRPQPDRLARLPLTLETDEKANAGGNQQAEVGLFDEHEESPAIRRILYDSGCAAHCKGHTDCQPGPHSRPCGTSGRRSVAETPDPAMGAERTVSPALPVSDLEKMYTVNIN